MRRLALVLLLVATPGWADEIAFDFRNSKFDDALFGFEPANASNLVKPEKEGLRFQLPGAGKSPRAPTGVMYRPNLAGDFTATMRYEILQVERPEKGYGVGAELYMIVGNPTRDGIVLTRLMTPGQGPTVMFNYMTNREDGKRTQRVGHSVPTTERSLRGQLRLTREGKILTAAIAEGDEAFQVIHRTEMPLDPVRAVRFSAISGNDVDARLDMRLLEFHVTEAKMTDGQPKAAIQVPVGEPIAPPAPPRRLFWTITILITGSILVIGLAGLLVVYRLTRAKPAMSNKPRGKAIRE